MSATILLVEDEPEMSHFVELYLRREGYETLIASDGLEAFRLYKESRIDLIILDIMLPYIDGTELCQYIRKESAIPIIMLTARVEEDDRLAGFEMGADDYVTKPFSPRELIARVKAILRRTDPAIFEAGQDQISYEGITVDRRLHEVRVNGDLVRLTPTEMRLLLMFLQEPGRVFTREQIIQQAFGEEYNSFDRTIDSHISNLRRKLCLEVGNARYIHTVYGVGYKLSQ